MSNYPALPETDACIVRVLREKDGEWVQEFICDWSHDGGMARSPMIGAAAINSRDWSQHVIDTEKKFKHNEGFVFELVTVSFTL